MATRNKSNDIYRASRPANCGCKLSASPSLTPDPRHRKIKTFARRAGDNYVINGSKIFTSRYQHSDMLLLLTRTHSVRSR